MGPHFSYLDLAGLLLSYLLKVTAGFLLCLGLVRLLRNPRHRFQTWLVFVLVSASYWAGIVVSELTGLSVRAIPAMSLPVRAAIASGRHLQIPLGWSRWVGRAGLILVWSYLACVLALLAATAWKHLQLRLMLKHGKQPSRELTLFFEATCRQLGVRRCKLVVLPGVVSPATAYWWRPRILLPEICNELGPTPELADVLCHELVHILRRDYLWTLVSDLASIFLFFHPAIWHARKQMRQQRELACDRAVVDARPDHRAAYASSLARFVRMRMLERSSSFGVDLAASASFLGTRIRCILSEPEKTPFWKKLSATAAGAVFFVTFAVVWPALSVLVDFAAQPSQVHAATLPRLGGSHHSAVQHHRKPGTALDQPSSPDTAAELPDTLTKLHVNPVRDTPEYRLSSDTYPTGAPEGTETYRPAWRDSSPADPRYAPPSVRSIVLTTVGGIAAERRGERTEHGHGH